MATSEGSFDFDEIDAPTQILARGAEIPAFPSVPRSEAEADRRDRSRSVPKADPGGIPLDRSDDGWPWPSDSPTPASIERPDPKVADSRNPFGRHRTPKSGVPIPHAESPVARRRGRENARLKIRLRLLVHALVTTGVALVLCSLGFLCYQTATAKRHTVEKLSTLGHVLAWSAKAALAMADAPETEVMPAAQVMLDALQQDHSIERACLFTSDGRVYAQYFRHDLDPFERQCLPETFAHEDYRHEGADIVWGIPIAFQRRTTGTLTMRAQTIVLRDELTRSGGIAAMVMCIAGLVAFAATARFERLVSRPILALIDTAQYVSRSKDYAVRVLEAGRDEFGLLIDSFNRMLQQIQVRDRELERQRDQLNHEVEARRAELRSRERAEDRIRYLAYFDVLTQLPNRQCLKERLDQSLRDSRRHGGYVAVLFLDLDRFKEINDNFGHGEGDHLLRLVAQRLDACVRGSDAISRHASGYPCFTVSRQGGDEFTIMLTRLKSRDDAGRVAERMLAEVRKPFALAGRDVHVGASIGIAVAPEDGGDVETLLKHADMAMYQAKQSGRDAFVFFSESMKIEAMRRLDLGSDLRRAVEWSDFKVYYQPKVDLHDGRVTGLEALLRWEHPSRGFISPADFIPLAEDLGLIGTLGKWVLTTVCAQLRDWANAGLPPVRVAVNVSSHQFADPLLFEAVRDSLVTEGLPPGMLELEITESAMIQNPDAAVNTLESLRALGIQVALDDFGTGYSSLNYVSRLPLDALKIDSSFVRCIADSEDGRSIVAAVVAMAHSLGLRVVAEGVETIEQARVLKRLRCDEIQGYLFSRPLPADKVVGLLHTSLDVDELEPSVSSVLD